MSELDKIDAHASKFNLIYAAKNDHEIYTGQIFVPYDIDYNVAYALGS